MNDQKINEVFDSFKNSLDHDNSLNLLIQKKIQSQFSISQFILTLVAFILIFTFFNYLLCQGLKYFSTDFIFLKSYFKNTSLYYFDHILTSLFYILELIILISTFSLALIVLIIPELIFDTSLNKESF